MLNNISILTEDQLDDAVEQVVFAVEEYMEIYTHQAEDVDEGLVVFVAEDIGVSPTPQVVNAVLYRVLNRYLINS